MGKTRDAKVLNLIVQFDDDEDVFPMLFSDDEPDGVSIPHSSTGLAGPTLPFGKLRPEENLLSWEETIPDVDRNDCILRIKY